MRFKFAFILLLFVVSTICRADDAVAPIKLIDLKLFPDTDQGYFSKPLDGSEFPESQQRELSILYFDKSNAGQSVTVQIIGEYTTLGAGKEVKKFDAVAIDADGKIPVELKFGKTVPPGIYRFDVIKGGNIVGSAHYIVKSAEAKKTAITAAKIDIQTEKPDGSLQSTAVPKAAEHHLYFIADTKGARTDGAHVVWSFTAVDTTAGKNQELPAIDVNGWPLDDTTLAYDMELPRDWPLGSYHVSLKVDDVVVKELDFQIKE